VFSIVYAALMRGLPYEGADRVTYVTRTNPSRDVRNMDVSIHDYVEYRARQRSFESLAAYYTGTANVSGTERAERYTAAWVTSDVLGSSACSPRSARDPRRRGRPGGERSAVIGHRTWQDRFGGDRNVVGRQLRVNGQPYTIVGVMPDSSPSARAQLWLPLQLDPWP
jgi:hypothetical protein